MTGKEIRQYLKSLDLKKTVKTKDLIKYFNMSRSTYMYLQKRLDLPNKDEKIEESVRIMKGEFKARPVFLSVEGSIKAHFMICFYL